VNIANNYGETPLHLAVTDGQETSVALLIQAGADVHKVNEDGNSPMELAMRFEASWKEDGHIAREAKRRRRKDDKKFKEFLSLSKRYYFDDALETNVSAYENILSLMRYAGAK
jgi:ankyrin repeat protein